MTKIKIKQKEETINFADTVLKVIKYIEINKKNEKNMPSSILVNVFAIQTQQKQVS